MIDEPRRPPRPGEELDLARLEPYLQKVLDAPGAPVTLSQFPGGHSNLTYLVTVGDREYVLRRPPFGSKVKTAHDMGREVRVLSHLAPVYPRAPRPVHFCEDESILGAKFYLMERVRGIILRRDPPPDVTLDPDTCARLCASFVDTLVELHALDYRAVGLADLGNPEGYVQRQVSGWTRRYQDSRTDEIRDVESVAAWLAEHLPPSPPATIIHNDYKFDNLVLDPDDPARIIGILDWEMSTIGDPLMDLGTTLCYWIQADDPMPFVATRFGPTHLPGMFARRQIAARYAEKSGRDLTQLPFYYAFGLFKTAVVAQQIYYRFHKGLTKDQRFAAMIVAVRGLAGAAARVVADPGSAP